jgi:hypothetical protein
MVRQLRVAAYTSRYLDIAHPACPSLVTLSHTSRFIAQSSEERFSSVALAKGIKEYDNQLEARESWIEERTNDLIVWIYCCREHGGMTGNVYGKLLNESSQGDYRPSRARYRVAKAMKHSLRGGAILLTSAKITPRMRRGRS